MASSSSSRLLLLLLMLTSSWWLNPCLVVTAAVATNLEVDHVPSFSSSSSSACAFTTFDELTKYHLDIACDRPAQNSYSNRLLLFQRGMQLHTERTIDTKAKATDSTPYHNRGIPHVPNEKTVTCPLTTASLLPPRTVAQNNGEDYQHVGFYTRWLVENTSTKPVVIAYVDHRHSSYGMEYSAVHTDITPPHADPDAILMPNQFKSIFTMEGHVYHVYELLGTSPDTYQLGRLLLQHRVGLIPVRNRLASPHDVSCPVDTSTGRVLDESPEEWHPNYQRSMARTNEHCNVLYRGFRNLVGCPVHAYYIGQSTTYQQDLMSMVSSTKEAAAAAATSSKGDIPTIASSTTTDSQNSIPSCSGEFKFHLGVNEQADDFENDWDSTTKFESTFTTHTYVFRLAQNTNVIVDSHTLTPTYIIDCPESNSKQQQQRVMDVHNSVAGVVVLPSGSKIGAAVEKDELDMIVHKHIDVMISNATIVMVQPTTGRASQKSARIGEQEKNGYCRYETNSGNFLFGMHNHSIDMMHDGNDIHYSGSSSSSCSLATSGISRVA